MRRTACFLVVMIAGLVLLIVKARTEPEHAPQLADQLMVSTP